MRANRPTWEILGSLLGLVILIVILNSAVGYYRQGSTDFAEQARVAGRPLTLTEVLNGDTGATEEITGTAGISGTEGITGTAVMTATASATATTDVAATADVTETTPVIVSTDVTATLDMTSTTEVTVTTTISEEADVETTSEPTTSFVITSTNELTPTDELTTTSGSDSGSPEATAEATASTTPEAAAPAEAPPELAAIFVKAGCIGCHVIPGVVGAVGMIGPNLTNIGVDAATRVEGLSSEEYIRQSLLEPNAFIAPECPTGACIPNLMVQNLDEILTSEELDAVVAYLSLQGRTAQ